MPIEKIERILNYHGGEKGDDGTSDVYGDGFDIVQDVEITMNDNEDKKLLNECDETETCVCGGADNASLSGSTRDYLPGAPTGWYPPGPPDDWKPWPRKVTSREPEFSTIDNPANWSEFTYRPTYSGKNRSGKYVAHKTLSGATVLPTNHKTGKCEVSGFELHYNGWKMPKPKQEYCHVGSTRDNFFPKARASNLDSEHLMKQGLTKKCMWDRDAFFQNLLTPVCEPSRSGIKDDPRLPYYTQVSEYTNLYAIAHLKWDGSYGRKFTSSIPKEYVHPDGIISCNSNDQVTDNYDINNG